MVPGAELAGLALATACACAVLTWAWIVVARRWGVQDLPGQRRVHAIPTPRGGGVAIVLAWLAALAWILRGEFAAAPPELAWLAGGVSGFLVLGLVDDLFDLGAMAKFALQVLLAAALFAPGMPGGIWLGIAGFAALWLGLVYFVNVWNFMDGINGIIGSQSLLVALAVATWPGQQTGLGVAALVLAGACLGFLPFNLPSARVFLGDAGSMGLGAALFLLLVLSWRNGSIQPVQALLLCSPVLLDTGLTLARRSLAGRRVWRAHREHLYQYAVRKGHSHARVSLAYAGATLLAWLLALAVGNRSSIVTVGLLTFICLLGSLVYFGLRRHWLARPIRTRSPG